MTPVSELPFNVRPTSRKEKNKLASRACRLKKKAQHEANKIKLNGLEYEHNICNFSVIGSPLKRILGGIAQAKQILRAKLIEHSQERQEELTSNLEKVIKNATKVKIAGQTTEYVNRILDKMKSEGYSTKIIDD
ncbi:hypothetical protein JTB14_012157 [Gonioctena quinquepunctata]|nr:hypothetical protein JTB14_012157 [Gonioctena quinquepunctata]